MPNIVSSLFGHTPIEIQQAQQAQIDASADRYASQQPFQRAAGQMFRAGAGLAQPVAGMLGMTNPQMEEARAAQDIMSQVDATSAEGLARGAMIANRMGQPRLAFQLAQAAQQQRASEAKAGLDRAKTLAELKKAESEASSFSKINPKDYTPESIGQYMKSKNPADLVAVNPDGKMSQKYLQLKEAYGDNPEVIRGKLQEWVNAEISGAGNRGTKVEVVLGKGDTKYSEKRLEGEAARISELSKAAESAFKTNLAIDRFIEASKKGTEGGAQPVISAAQNFLASFGYSPESLQDVRQMEQAVGDILGTKMQELGARGLTDKDMQILRDALPRVSTDRASRENIARIIKKASEFTLNEYHTAREEEGRIYPELATRIPDPAWYKSYKTARNTWSAQSPADVKVLYKSGRITKDEATAMLDDMAKAGKF